MVDFVKSGDISDQSDLSDDDNESNGSVNTTFNENGMHNQFDNQNDDIHSIDGDDSENEGEDSPAPISKHAWMR